jgi:hypothetical protein
MSDSGIYELWDTESGNAIGEYSSVSAALADVADSVREYGANAPEVLSMALIRTDLPVGKGHVAAGAALVALASGCEHSASPATRAAS